MLATMQVIADRPKEVQSVALEATKWGIAAWAPQQNKAYFHFGPILPTSPKQDDFAECALAEVMQDLSGLAVDAIARSERETCKRLFIRLQAGRKHYCSDRCRLQAMRERKKQAAKPVRKPSCMRA